MVRSKEPFRRVGQLRRMFCTGARHRCLVFFFGASQNIMTLVLFKCLQIVFICFYWPGQHATFGACETQPVGHSANYANHEKYTNYLLRIIIRPCSTAAQPTTKSTVHALQQVNRLQNQLSMFYTRTTTPPSNLHKIKDPTLNSAALGTSIPTYRVFTKSTAPRKNAALTKSPTPPPQKWAPGNELFCLQYRSSFCYPGRLIL